MKKRVSVYLEQEILSAGGLRLIHLSYQAAITEIRDARRNMAAGRIPEKCANLTKACAIVVELRNSLNREEGGDIATNLEALYGYMLSRLLDANLRKLQEPLVEVLTLLSTLDEAWKELADEEATQRESANSNDMLPGAFPVELTRSAVHSWSL